jgi:hypothetical protein
MKGRVGTVSAHLCINPVLPRPSPRPGMRLCARIGELGRIEMLSLRRPDGPVDVTVTEIPATAQTDIHTCPV